MVKSVTMLMSNKILYRGTQFVQTSGIKKEQKQQNNQTTDLKQTQRRIHDQMKQQNLNRLQKQSAALGR